MDSEEKRKSWSAEEIESILLIIKELQVIRLIDGKRFRTSDILKKVEDAFNSKGFNRTSAQLTDKYKALKKKYMAAKNGLGKSGAGTGLKKQCPYYEELDDIFGYRPTANQSGIDSTSLPPDSDNNKTSTSCVRSKPYPVSKKRKEDNQNVEPTAGCSTASSTPVMSEENSSSQTSLSMSSFSEENDSSYPPSTGPRFELSTADPSERKNISCKNENSRIGQIRRYTRRDNPRSGLKTVMHDFADKIIKSQNDLLEKMFKEQSVKDNDMMMQYNNIFTQQTQLLLEGFRSLGRTTPINNTTFAAPTSSANQTSQESMQYGTYHRQSLLRNIENENHTSYQRNNTGQSHTVLDHAESPGLGFTSNGPDTQRLATTESLIKRTVIKCNKNENQQPPSTSTMKPPTSINDRIDVPLVVGNKRLKLVCKKD